MKKTSCLICVIIFFSLFVIRTWFISSTPVIDDESYYYMYSKHLAGGYIDHGPVVAYIIKFFTAIFGENGFGIRFGSVLLLTTLGLILYKFGEKYFNKITGIILSLTITTNVLFHTNGVVITPDTPLAFFSFLFILSYYIGFFHNKVFFIPGGFFLGLGLLSKISAIFPALGVFLFPILIKQHRKALKQSHYYISFLIALFIFSPFIIWNFQNDWAFVRYQGEHISAAGSLGKFIELWLGLFILLGGPLFLFCTIVPCKVLLEYYLLKTEKNSAIIYFSLTSFIPLIYFVIHSSVSSFELNWLAPALYGGILLFGIMSGNRIGKSIFFQLFYSLTLVVLVSIQVYYPLLPLKGKSDITNRYHMYSFLHTELSSFLNEKTQFNNYRLVSNNYQLPSMINLYLKPKLEALCLSIGYHQTLYSFLYPDSTLIGDDYLFITKGNDFPPHLTYYFDGVILLERFVSTRNKEHLANFSLWYVKNYRGK